MREKGRKKREAEDRGNERKGKNIVVEKGKGEN